MTKRLSTWYDLPIYTGNNDYPNINLNIIVNIFSRMRGTEKQKIINLTQS